MKTRCLCMAVAFLALVTTACGSDAEAPGNKGSSSGSDGANATSGSAGDSTAIGTTTADSATMMGTGVTTGTTTTGSTVTSATTTTATATTGSEGVGGATTTTASDTTAGGGATEGAGGSSTTGNETTTGNATDPVTLDQAGNPVYGLLDGYTSWLGGSLAVDETLANNMITWQMPHGGFDKNKVSVYGAPWDGSSSRSGWTGEGGSEIGTIDNGGTTTELMFLADVYARSGNAKYRDSARAAFEWLLTMQYPSGGFPQVYPARAGSSYSNHVTFNDDAMVRALLLLKEAVDGKAPLDGDLFTTDQLARAEAAIANGVEYILNAQIVQAGVRTVWCAQHDPTTFEPHGARSYELPSKSGSESAGVVEFLMTQPQTEQVRAAAQAALAWYASNAVKVEGTRYVSRPSSSTDDNYNPIQPSSGSTMWYRFYDLDQDVGFFSGRLPTDNPPGVGKKYDIMEIEPERRYGYQWGGAYGVPLLEYAASVGY